MTLSPNKIKQVRQRNFLGKDFDSFRTNLLNYSRAYYSDVNTDFSENSIGGMFMDMVAYVGDSLSFYLDHQFNELNIETAVETINIQKLLRAAGVKVTGASPATATCTIFIEVPSSKDSSGNDVPQPDALPVVGAGTIFSTSDGKAFTLQEDVDFSETKPDGTLKAVLTVGRTTQQGTTQTFIMSREAECLSGFQKTTTVSIGDFVQFRRVYLPDSDVSEVIQVFDSEGNTYYEVNDLADDVVYQSTRNYGRDSEYVPYNLQIKPAPYRFTKTMDIDTRRTYLTFGGGEASTLQDDAIPDPSEFALKLPYSKNFSRTALNPQKLLTTRTLGVATSNTTLTIIYRYGGGLSYNVGSNTINNVSSLSIRFPSTPLANIARAVVQSLEVTNNSPAAGGEDAMSIDELKALASSVKNSQERIVTKEDLLARVYTLPSSFGRVYRASVRPDPKNILASRLFVLSRNDAGQLVASPDSLKVNLARYLNTYRAVSDSIDIYDAPVVNLKLTFKVLVDHRQNSYLVLQDAITRLRSFFETSRWQIDQPIILSDIMDILFSTNGIISLPETGAIRFDAISGNQNGRTYSDYVFDVNSNFIKGKGIIIPPEGGMFEIRYPDQDIEGKNV